MTYATLQKYLYEDIKNGLDIIIDQVFTSLQGKKFKTLEDYRQLLSIHAGRGRTPVTLEDWRSDESFARQRL